MAAMTSILVKDDASTVYEWTFGAITDNPEPFWRGMKDGVPIEGQPRLTLSNVKLKNQGYKVTAKLEVPVMETLGASGTSAGYVAPPRVAYVTTCIFTMFVDRRSIAQDRANALKMAVGLLAGASGATGTGTMSQASAANSFLNSVMPVPFAFTQLVQPN